MFAPTEATAAAGARIEIKTATVSHVPNAQRGRNEQIARIARNMLTGRSGSHNSAATAGIPLPLLHRKTSLFLNTKKLRQLISLLLKLKLRLKLHLRKESLTTGQNAGSAAHALKGETAATAAAVTASSNRLPRVLPSLPASLQAMPLLLLLSRNPGSRRRLKMRKRIQKRMLGISARNLSQKKLLRRPLLQARHRLLFLTFRRFQSPNANG
jgi:hypothetical protein